MMHMSFRLRRWIWLAVVAWLGVVLVPFVAPPRATDRLAGALGTLCTSADSAANQDEGRGAPAPATGHVAHCTLCVLSQGHAAPAPNATATFEVSMIGILVQTSAPSAVARHGIEGAPLPPRGPPVRT